MRNFFLSPQRLFGAFLGLFFILYGGCQTQWPSLETQTRLWTNQQLYDDVWQTIERDYLDPSLNGQDWARWRHRYDGWLLNEDETFTAIETMVASLGDDYTLFMRPRDMAEQAMQIDARLFGVGLELMKLSGGITVVGVLPESPAKKSRIRPGDKITSIDGQSVSMLSIEAAADKIRGAEGSVVTLTIERTNTPKNAVPQHWQETLKRAEIKLHDLWIDALGDRASIGYIQIQSFIGETLEADLSQAFAKFRHKKGLIIDLRGNSGGLLSNAVSVSDMLLDSGVIVSIEGRQNGHQAVIQAYHANRGQLFEGPVAVLIDGGSASASEIVSAALHDHHRAVLIGQRSFGKGLVQKVVPLEQSAGLNLTVSRYLTPRGQNIHHNGIAPDMFIPEHNDNKLVLPISTHVADLDTVKRQRLQQDPVVKAAIRWLDRHCRHQPSTNSAGASLS
ncbi:MAG: S41 family peptidase [Vampirovibrionales bacterium]|nr:S41 family peptidase [Vampirovibrionales bacterium]